MFKNVAGQTFDVQMITAADGTAFTGTVSAVVSKDGAAQGAITGSISHLGSGCHKVSPSQADTNGDHLGFTFTGPGAIPVTIQVETQDKFVADVLNASAKTMMYATVTAGTSGTSFTIGTITNASGASQTPGANSLAGRRVYFRGDTTTTALRNCGGRITANTNASSSVLTIDSNDTLPATPANGDVVVIL